LSNAQINISGELGRSTQSIQDILFLQIDDIIYLNSGPQDPVIINIEDVPKYLGSPGVCRGNASVQINDCIRKSGGGVSHVKC
jgi:flagellar motor switch protein FliM